MKNYQSDIEAVAQQLRTNLQTGLTQKEAQARLEKDGPNALPEGKQDSWLSIFISQFQSPLIYILLIAAVIIFFVGDHNLDAFIISGVLFFNAIVGTIQEGRTSNIIASLKRFVKAKSIVFRNGKNEIIDDYGIVVGDIIVLQQGERVPADARLIEVDHLQIDESMLTGESKPVHKTVEPLSAEIGVADQINMVFRGTYVVAGHAKALVVATGLHTEIGKLHKSIEEISTDIPLRKELNRLSYFILLFIFILCVILLSIGLLMGRQFNELMIMLTALFICVVPEGLPVVLTLVLVTGAYRMAKQNVLIRNLQGVESLGRTDVIVIDKTGTLTRNEMMVTQIFADNKTYTVTGQGYFPEGKLECDGVAITCDKQSALGHIGIASILLDTAQISFDEKLKLFEIKGDPTEAALGICAQKLGYTKEEIHKTYKKNYEMPFDSNRKYHAGFFSHDSRGVAYIIGAPEKLFSMSGDVPESMHKQSDAMLKNGLRIVAVGYKEYDVSHIKSEQEYENVLNQITILGLCGMQDSIRPEVQAMIEDARQAGLHIVMATGDHTQTALYVAKAVGIYKEGDKVIDGSELTSMSDDDLLKQLDNITVFSRVSPQDKVRIINAFHKKNLIVGMTGDGVNDVPSLVAADLGIAMGGIGTEVAKQASDLVLLDDSFVNIIHAIEQGRHIFYALRRVVLYFFATNMGEILIVLFALFTHLPLPLTAAQILWLNLVTDGFLDAALALEPQEEGLLHAQWLKNRTRLVDGNLIMKMMYFAVPMGIVSLIVFSWQYDGTPASIPHARTMTLITMAMFQWFNAWNCRSEGKSLWEIGLFSNRWLIGATLLVLSLQFALCYLPFMQFIFKTVPLSVRDWIMIFALTSPLVVVEETRKWVVRTWGIS